MQKILSASLLALAIMAPAAHAYEAGDIIVRAGVVTVNPNEDSDDIYVGALKTSVPGTGVGLDSDTQLGLNFVYMLDSNLAIEVLAATPFSHSVSVKGMPGPFAGLNGKLGDLKHLPPTISVNYYPMDSTSLFQPYVGLGINYTWFFDTELTGSAEKKGFSGLDLEDSVGIAAQVGFDYMLTENVMLNAQLRYIDIETEGRTSFGGEKVTVDVDVDPFAYMVGVGYKF